MKTDMKTVMTFLASVQKEKPRKYYAVKNGKVVSTHMLKPSQLKQFSINMGCTFMRHLPVALKGKDSAQLEKELEARSEEALKRIEDKDSQEMYEK